MRKKRKFLVFTLTLCLVTSVIPFSDYKIVQAASTSSQINNAQDKIDNLEEKQKKAQDQKSEVEDKKKELEAAVKELDAQLNASMQKYDSLKGQQDTLKKKIDATEAALEEAQAKEDTQYEDMKLRIQYMYEVGNQSYLELLLSSKNIVDFINNAAYIVELSIYDRDMLKEYQQTKQGIADDKKSLENDNKQLSSLVNDAKKQYQDVNRIVENKTEQVESYKSQIAELEGNMDVYEDQIDEQTELIASLEKKAADEAAAAKAAAAAAAAASNKNNSSQSSGNTSYSSGNFSWPCPASHLITSEYGYRNHPSTGKYSFHSGIDIGAGTGSNIVAAAGGVVTSAGYNGSMGNYVMISHGGGLVTIYMHASVLCVSSGETVSAGETIALVGSTGDSTGPHLHFSVRLNGSYVSPWDYL